MLVCMTPRFPVADRSAQATQNFLLGAQTLIPIQTHTLVVLRKYRRQSRLSLRGLSLFTATSRTTFGYGSPFGRNFTQGGGGLGSALGRMPYKASGGLMAPAYRRISVMVSLE